jgi:hypothetical protein
VMNKKRHNRQRRLARRAAAAMTAATAFSSIITETKISESANQYCQMHEIFAHNRSQQSTNQTTGLTLADIRPDGPLHLFAGEL